VRASPKHATISARILKKPIADIETSGGHSTLAPGPTKRTRDENAKDIKIAAGLNVPNAGAAALGLLASRHGHLNDAGAEDRIGNSLGSHGTVPDVAGRRERGASLGSKGLKTV
jgi:hypothetical protein